MKKQIIVLSVVLAMLIGMAIYVWYLANNSYEVQYQERIEYLTSEKQVIDVSQDHDEITLPSESEPNDVIISDLDYVDNKIHGKYQESWAYGHIDCVLEIPAIKLRQNIYTGTSNQIEHDLGLWMAVTARADYILGDTQYCIYMHNPSDKDITISYAQEILTKGDYMVVTKDNLVYFYEITNIFGQWRDKCTVDYVNASSVPSNKLYVFTCARNEWQGKNLVIEGTAYAIYDITQWAESHDDLIQQYKNSINSVVEEEEARTPLTMYLQPIDGGISVDLMADGSTNVDGCTIGVFDADGYLVENIENPIRYSGSTIAICDLSNGEYYVGVYDGDDQYESPTPYKITINVETDVKEIVTMEELIIQDEQRATLLKTVAMACLIIAIIFGFATILIVIKRNR
jgi:sortase (surface protein transpeptidase)